MILDAVLGRSAGASTRARRIVLLSPGFFGADGVSSVARSALTALRGLTPKLEACSLGEARAATWPPDVDGASGDRLKFIAWTLRSALHATPDTLVVAMHLHLAPAALPLVVRGARLAVFLHGIEAWSPLTPVRALALGRAHVLLTNSSATWSRAVAANPRLSRRSPRVCHLGAPPAPAPETHPDLVPGFVLVVGRLHEGYKGHDELLELWPRVLQARPDARLVIAGDGPDRARLESKAAASSLGASVRFLGRVSDAVLAGLYRDCAFFALPSVGEGFGLVFLEAMRAGKACLAAPGAAEEVVLAGQTGLIVDPRRPTELLDAVLRLLDDAALCQRLGDAGRARWAAEFTAEAFGRRLRSALDLPVEG